MAADAMSILAWVIRACRLHCWAFAVLPRKVQLACWRRWVSPRVPVRLITTLRTMYAVAFAPRSKYQTQWQRSESYQLEQEVGRFLGVKHVAMVNSGTSALYAALVALGVGPGDEVVVPTYTWVATASAVCAVGAVPVMADIDETLGMSYSSLSAVCSERTKAVIVVHMRGVPCAVEEIQRVCEERGLLLVEDCAQAFGARVGKKMCGTFGRVGIASMNIYKTFHCGGQGGLIWTDDDELAKRAMWAFENGVAAWHGLANIPSYKGSFPKEAEGARFTNQEIPYALHCFRAPSEVHAAFARSQLRNFEADIDWLRALKAAFREELRPEYHSYLQQVADPAGDISFSVTLLLEDQRQRDALKAYLAAQGGVPAEHDFWQNHFLPNVKGLMQKQSFHQSGYPWMTAESLEPVDKSDFRASVELMERSLSLEFGYHFSKAMAVHAARMMNEFFELQAN